ncbi:MAG: hypothetical protein ABIE23_05935 [archaeon]|nr:hypothetical protein [Candidatus Micrarchaeota archaeon]
MGRPKKHMVEKDRPISFTVTKSQIGREASGTHGSIRGSKVYFGKAAVPFVAKVYQPHLPKDQARNDFRMLSMFRSIGCKVVPTFMCVKPNGMNPILVLTDLRRGGKFVVQSMVKTKNVKNKKEIDEIVKKNVLLASKHGIHLRMDSWVVAIDKKTRIGTPYISDVVGCFGWKKLVKG